MRRVTISIGFATAVLSAGGAAAEGLILSGSTKGRMSVFESQARLLDTRLASQYEASARLKPKSAVDEDNLPRYGGSYKGEYLEAARTAARQHGVPEDLFLRLVQQESGWNPTAVSVKGATGLAQLMPDTALLLEVDIADPIDNLTGGARYLRMMYDKFGTWRLALAAYNAGPQAVEQHDGIPPYKETQNYVVVILGS